MSGIICIGYRQRSFTLCEMLSVLICAALILGVLFHFVKEAHSCAASHECGSQLRQVGLIFSVYKEDYHLLPEFAPPAGLGDYSNWADLYASTDPEGTYFSSRTLKNKLLNGIAVGDLTGDPRIPRIFQNYGVPIEALCCPSQGPSAYWKDIGPYYYNTTNPFNTNPLQNWQALCRSDPTLPLAACQNPEYLLLEGNRGWRHGDRSLKAGTNNQLYLDGSIRKVTAPPSWSGR